MRSSNDEYMHTLVSNPACCLELLSRVAAGCSHEGRHHDGTPDAGRRTRH